MNTMFLSNSIKNTRWNLLVACLGIWCGMYGQEPVYMNITKKFLAIPQTFQDSIGESKVRVTVEGDNYLYEPMNFSHEGKQWWSNLDMSQYQGKNITLFNIPEYMAGQIQQSNTIVGHPNLYKEINRPQFHPSFRHGVLGDPTAKFYYAPKDEWHMFFIYNPFRGKEVSWGHMVSKDLIHWEERPPVYAFKHKIFNGTGFVDTRNHLGLNENGQQAIVLLQPIVGQKGGTFSYSISTDGGENFEPVNTIREKRNRQDLPENPLASGWHDAPRIYWSEENQQYVLYLKRAYQVVHQYISKDLKTWTQIEDVPAIPESFTFEGDPGELVDMTLVEDPKQKFTVVMYGLHGYIVGQYTAKGMVNLNGEPIDKDDLILTAHFGYPTIFHNPKDGRVIMSQNLGNNGVGGIPNYEFNYYPDVSFPVELTLHESKEGPRLRFNPISEIQSLYGKKHSFSGFTVKEKEHSVDTKKVKGHTYRMQLTLKPENTEQFGIRIYGSSITYDLKHQMLAVDTKANDPKTDRKRRKLELNPDGTLTLDILVDRTSLEVFANEGQIYIPHGRQKLYEATNDGIKIFTKGGKVKVTSLSVTELKSIW